MIARVHLAMGAPMLGVVTVDNRYTGEGLS